MCVNQRHQWKYSIRISFFFLYLYKESFIQRKKKIHFSPFLGYVLMRMVFCWEKSCGIFNKKLHWFCLVVWPGLWFTVQRMTHLSKKFAYDAINLLNMASLWVAVNVFTKHKCVQRERLDTEWRSKKTKWY